MAHHGRAGKFAVPAANRGNGGASAKSTNPNARGRTAKTTAPDRTAAACSAAIDRILARGETADQDRMARHTVAKTRYSWRAGAQAYLALLENLASTASPDTQAARPVQSQDTR